MRIKVYTFDEMNAREFFYLVAQMRTAQKEYFSDRSQQNLKRSIVLEREVDEEIRRVKELVLVQESREMAAQ